MKLGQATTGPWDVCELHGTQAFGPCNPDLPLKPSGVCGALSGGRSREGSCFRMPMTVLAARGTSAEEVAKSYKTHGSEVHLCAIDGPPTTRRTPWIQVDAACRSATKRSVYPAKSWRRGGKIFQPGCVSTRSNRVLKQSKHSRLKNIVVPLL